MTPTTGAGCDKWKNMAQNFKLYYVLENHYLLVKVYLVVVIGNTALDKRAIGWWTPISLYTTNENQAHY